jgi:hypothetical protein
MEPFLVPTNCWTGGETFEFFIAILALEYCSSTVHNTVQVPVERVLYQVLVQYRPFTRSMQRFVL